jgi:CBS domain-containing protein
MEVHEIMTQAVKTVDVNASVAEAADLMGTYNIGALPVCDDNRLVGMITDRDILLRCVRVGKPPTAMKAVEVMTRDPVLVAPDEPIEEAARKMGANGFRRLPVVENGNLVGILSADDIARRSTDALVASMARQIASHAVAAV